MNRISKTDWAAFDAMTEQETYANAMSDPDALSYGAGAKVKMIKGDGATVIERFRKAIQRESKKPLAVNSD